VRDAILLGEASCINQPSFSLHITKRKAEIYSRARRRFEEDRAKGRVSTYEQTLAEINERDERDVSRADSPLTIAEDAVVIDTSELDLTEVFEAMLAKISEQKASAA